MISVPRLITRTDVLTQLLAAIAAMPPGVKLNIPRLRDALVSQADVIAGIETLIMTGEIDARTLRAPEPRVALPEKGDPWRRLDDVEAVAIKREIGAFLTRSGMSPCRFGRECLHDPKFVGSLDHRQIVRGKTAARIRAFIASGGVPPQGEGAGVAASTPAPAPSVTPIVAAPGVRKVRPYCTQPGACTAPSRGPCRLCQPRLAPSSDPRPIDARRSAATRKAATTEAERLLDANPEATCGRNGAVTQALAGVKHQRAAEARQTDPVEQARLALQRKGRSVYAADVDGGKKGHFRVSGMRDQAGRLREVTPAALIAEAERLTGLSFRRVAGQPGGAS